MTRFEQLIAEFCPDGVVYQTLNDVCDFRRGSFPQPYGLEQWYDDVNGAPFVQVFDVLDDDNFLLSSSTKRKISKLAQAKSVFVPTGSIVITINYSHSRRYNECRNF